MPPVRMVQVQRWWVNWPGQAVVKHLALQIQAMEQMREQRQQHQRHSERQQHQQRQQPHQAVLTDQGLSPGLLQAGSKEQQREQSSSAAGGATL